MTKAPKAASPTAAMVSRPTSLHGNRGHGEAPVSQDTDPCAARAGTLNSQKSPIEIAEGSSQPAMNRAKPWVTACRNRLKVACVSAFSAVSGDGRESPGAVGLRAAAREAACPLVLADPEEWGSCYRRLVRGCGPS